MPPPATSGHGLAEHMASLDDADLTLRLGAREGQERVLKAQRRLLALRLQLGGLIDSKELGPPLCVLLEGWDASGKGGAIRRLVSPLDPRHVRVAQFAAPTPDEKRHHFLNRFAAPMPGWGGMAVLDRSWYGRVLVERVEGFATEAEWRRAYAQIVGWEAGLATEGTVLVKFWLPGSQAEQLRRLPRPVSSRWPRRAPYPPPVPPMRSRSVPVDRYAPAAHRPHTRTPCARPAVPSSRRTP